MLGSDEEREDVRAECVRVARRIKHSGRKVIGLVPIDDRVAVPPIGMALGAALGQLMGAPVGYVDANVRWPALVGMKLPSGSGISGGSIADDETAFTTRWIADHFAVLSPDRSGAAGAGVPELARLIRSGGELFAHLIVDLTGFDRLGEHLAALEMVDGVALIGRVGVSREEQMVALWRDLPETRRLGVLLIGGGR